MSANQPNMTIVNALRDLPTDKEALQLLLEVSFLSPSTKKIYGEDAVRILASQAGQRLAFKHSLLSKSFTPETGPSVSLTNEGAVVASQLKTRAMVSRLNKSELDVIFAFEMFRFGTGINKEELQQFLMNPSSWSSINKLVNKGAVMISPEDANHWQITPLGIGFQHEARRQIEELLNAESPSFDYEADRETLKDQISKVYEYFELSNHSLPELSPFEQVLEM